MAEASLPIDLIAKTMIQDLSSMNSWATYICCPDRQAIGYIKSSEEMVLAGLHLSQSLFHAIDPKLSFEVLKKEGDVIRSGEKILKVEGSLHSILKAENLVTGALGHLSAVAQKAYEISQLIEPYGTLLIDGNRFMSERLKLDRYASHLGGAKSRRLFLKDCISVGRSHIKASSGITACLNRLLESFPPTSKVEVYCVSLAEVHEALDAGAHVAILPMLPLAELEMAVRSVRKRMYIEVSGFFSNEQVEKIARTGVDFISLENISMNKWMNFQLDMDTENA